jgi:predicted secreted protein
LWREARVIPQTGSKRFSFNFCPRMKALYILTAAVVVAVTTALPRDGLSHEPLRLSEPLPEKVEVEIGREIELRLEALLGAGFSWSIDVPANAPVRLISSRLGTKSSGTPGTDGQTDVQIFTLSAISPGITTIALQYKRPWLEEIERQQKVVVIVR